MNIKGLFDDLSIAYQMNRVEFIGWAIFYLVMLCAITAGVKYNKAVYESESCSSTGKYAEVDNKKLAEFYCKDGRIRWLEVKIETKYAS
jgi:hypothetical protein